MQKKQLWLPVLAAGCLFAADPSLRVSEADAKKAAIERPAPEYPLAARQLKVVGKVNLEVLVGVDGTVTDVRILSGSPILTRPAAQALKKWRFRPFLSDGKPSAALVAMSFEFDTH
jgi:protein TonB